MGKSFHTRLLSSLLSSKPKPYSHHNLPSRFSRGRKSPSLKSMGSYTASLMGIVLLVSGCGSFSSNSNSSPPVSNSGAKPTTAASVSPINPEDTALTESLYLDELLQQGFTSKDFWQIRFEHVYITFDGKGRTIDLSDGDEPLGAILSQWRGNEMNTASDATNPAKSSQLSGRIIKASGGPSQGYSIYLQGKAYRENNRIEFTLKFEQDFLVKCPSQGSGKSKSDGALSLRLENLFGDARLPAEGEVNQGALGFDALTELAEKESLTMDMAMLKQRLSPEAIATLQKQLGRLIYLGDQVCETKAES